MSFTLDQIHTAHAKVKNGSDFPQYMQDIIQLGVTAFTTYVVDGHTEYSGSNDFNISSGGLYPQLTIAHIPDAILFTNQLRAHQQGQTDFPTFCNDCANAGIEKWVVSMAEMTCTYYDRSGKEVLKENIPGV